MVQEMMSMVQKINQMEANMAQLTQQNVILQQIADNGSRGDNRKPKGLIDTKELARMDTLETAAQWADWSTRFKDAVGARGHLAARHALDAMEALSEKEAGANKAADIARAAGRDKWSQLNLSNDTWVDWANDLYYILEDMTKSEATVIVRNSVDGTKEIPQDGFRAWRNLKHAMNPKTPARRLQCFMDVVAVREIKDKREVNTSINIWLRKVAKLQAEFKETISASLRTALLISMLPKDMQISALQQVDLKDDSEEETVRESVFKDIIDKVKSVINSEIIKSTPTPMEGVTIGAMAERYGEANSMTDWSGYECDWNNDGQFAYYGDAEINAVGNGECFTCGQKGHRSAECPKGKGKGMFGKGAGGKGNYGKGSFGKGNFGKGNFGKGGYFNMAAKGFDKGQWEQPRRRACFACGSLDHLQRDCPRIAAAVEETGVANVSSRHADDDVIIIGNVNVDEEEFVAQKTKKKKRVCKKLNFAEEPEVKKIWTGQFDELSVDYEFAGDSMIVEVEDYHDNNYHNQYKKVDKKKEAKTVLGPQIVAEIDHIEICQVGLGEETIVGLTFQSTDVKKALAAVWRVCEKGNVIQFGDEPEDCFIKNKKSGRKIFMRKKKGSYVLDVEFVLKKDGETISLGKGEITVDSAAEESVCPHDWGGAFPLTEPKRKMNFKTASGQEMEHYGERTVTCITQTRPGPSTSVFRRQGAMM